MKNPTLKSTAAEWYIYADAMRTTRKGREKETIEEYYTRLIDEQERKKEKWHESLNAGRWFSYCKPYYFISKNYYNVFCGREMEMSHLGHNKRGRVSRFSAQSRRRFQLRIEEYADVSFTWFITLTYELFQADMNTCYRHLENFCKALDRVYGAKHLYIWKKEFQRRGVVHYHLICNLPETLDKKLVTRLWNKYAGQVYRKNGKLNKSSTNCSRVKKQSSIGWYLSQYVEKKNHQTEAPVDRLCTVNRRGDIVNGYIGRWWGVINKKSFARRLIERVAIDEKTAILIEALIHKKDKDSSWKQKEYRTNFYYKDKQIADEIARLVDDTAFNYGDDFCSVCKIVRKCLT